MRADLAVLERGWALTRNQAQALLLSGIILEGDHRITKAGAQVELTKLRLQEEPKKYVGRGALKLASFLKSTPEIHLLGKNACDVGASTGGFTDYLLQSGVDSVTCVDVGTNQLDWRLRSHPRVKCFEKTDIRSTNCQLLGRPQGFDLVVVDLSFISVRKCLSCIYELGAPQSDTVILFKPQFEVGREFILKGGIVKDEEATRRALDDCRLKAQELGWTFKKEFPSEVKGVGGNQEIFLWLKRA